VGELRYGTSSWFANDHYAGHGPATIAELAALVDGREPSQSDAPPPGELPF